MKKRPQPEKQMYQRELALLDTARSFSEESTYDQIRESHSVLLKEYEQLISESINRAKKNDANLMRLRMAIYEKEAAQNQLRVEERRAEDLRCQAENAKRIKSEFLNNISHEVRTPLNAIVGMLYLIQRTHLTPKQQRFIQKVQSAAHSLLNIINDILDFSKIEAGQLELEKNRFSIAKLIESVGNIVNTKASAKGITVHWDVEQSVPLEVVGDYHRTQQIFLNLCDNAVKFSNDGDIYVAVTAKTVHTCVKLSARVIDTGIGMSKKQLSGLFDKFTQGDTSVTRAYEGAGLGLAICKQLCELMGGHIEVHSEPNMGSTFSFTIYLQATGQYSSVMRESRSYHASKCLNGKKVLLVEDNPLNREYVSELLADIEVEVSSACNGHQALEKIQESHFDLVLMDIQMQEMDGLTAAKKIRSLPDLRDIPIIAMTAHAMHSDFNKSIAAGMNDHITKPLDPVELIAVIHRWLLPENEAGGRIAVPEGGCLPAKVQKNSAACQQH